LASLADSSTTIYVSNLISQLAFAVILGSAFALVLGVVRLVKRKWIGILLLLVGGICGLSGLREEFMAFLEYQDFGGAFGNDGREYHVLEEAFLQGYDVRIGRTVEHSLLGSRYQVVAVGPGSYYQKHLKLSTPYSRETTLAKTTNGILMGISGGSNVFVAFDPAREVAYGQTEILDGVLGIKEVPIAQLDGNKIRGSNITLIASDALE